MFVPTSMRSVAWPITDAWMIDSWLVSATHAASKPFASICFASSPRKAYGPPIPTPRVATVSSLRRVGANGSG